MQDRLNPYWLAVMLVEAQNGPAEPNDENFLCAHDDVIQRVRVHNNMKFATGVSGGAFMSSRFVTYRTGFRGIILQAEGIDLPEWDSEWFWVNKKNLYTFATFGNTDFNLYELDELKAIIPAERFNYEVFEGGHQEAPVETLNRAFTWLMANIVEQEYAILGKVKVRNNVPWSKEFEMLSNVTISFGSGYSTTTGDLHELWGDKDYWFTKYSIDVKGNGTNTLSAHKNGYSFTPAQRLITLPPEAFDQDFEIKKSIGLPWLSLLLTEPVNGTCGSANGIPTYSKPTTNLCSIGTASNPTLVTIGYAKTFWRWTCEGLDGGSTATCSALYPVW